MESIFKDIRILEESLVDVPGIRIGYKIGTPCGF
jgi:hypothetical protein